MDQDKPLILNVAVTGAVPLKSRYPLLPQEPDEIVQVVAECFDLGARVFHIHMRDRHGTPTQDPGRYIETISGIRETSPEAIICATTSSRASGSFEDRIRPLLLEKPYLPDFSSLSLGSFNFPDSISRNPLSEIREILSTMNQVGVRPELEVFEPGMIEVASILRDEQLLSGKLVFNVLLGNVGSSTFNAASLGYFSSTIPQDAEWSVAGIGRYQKRAIFSGISLGLNVRLGMEDAPNVSGDRKWSNQRAVALATKVAEQFGRPIESPSGARLRLGLTDS